VRGDACSHSNEWRNTSVAGRRFCFRRAALHSPMTTIRALFVPLALVASLHAALASAQDQRPDYLKGRLDFTGYMLEGSDDLVQVTLGSDYNRRSDGLCDEVRISFADPDRTKPQAVAPAIKTERLIVPCIPVFE